MISKEWFYRCYKKDTEKLILLSFWKAHAQANYETLALHTSYFDSLRTNVTPFYVFSFLNTKLFMHRRGVNSYDLLPGTLFDSYETFGPINSFLQLRKSSFISFFIDNMIDVPICFKKSHSLRMRNFELPLLKFSNFLMKKGKREKAIRILMSAFNLFYAGMNKDTYKTTLTSRSWLDFSFFLNSGFFLKKRSIDYRFGAQLSSSYGTSFFKYDKNLTSDACFKNYLLDILVQVSPIFSFFIYNVDKNVRKFSRGKSGKYVFVWKYIASYKRLYVAMRWIMKDIKFSNNRKVVGRVESVLLRLVKEPHTSFANKSYIFSHNYVFRNLRKTLMTTLKTIT